MTPEEIVRVALDAWSTLDADEITRHFAPDAVLEGGPVGVFRGCDQIRKMASSYVDKAAWCHHEILNMATVDNTCLTERLEHWVLKDGKKYDFGMMGAFEVGGDKITEWRDYYHLDADVMAWLQGN